MARLQKLAPELLYLIFRVLPLPDLAALECVLPAFAPIFKDIALPQISSYLVDGEASAKDCGKVKLPGHVHACKHLYDADLEGSKNPKTGKRALKLVLDTWGQHCGCGNETQPFDPFNFSVRFQLKDETILHFDYKQDDSDPVIEIRTNPEYNVRIRSHLHRRYQIYWHTLEMRKGPWKWTKLPPEWFSWLKDGSVLLRTVFLKKVSTGEPVSCTGNVCACEWPRFGWEFVRFTATWDVLEDPPLAISEFINRKALDRR